MTFKLRIPGRDYIEAAPAANSANPLIRIEAANEVLSVPVTFSPISGLAGLAAPEISNVDDDAQVERSAIISADGVPYWEADDMAGLPAWTDAEIATFEKRQARATWLGYGSRADRVADMLLHRDRDMGDRKLCIECAHAGPGWRCAKRDAFMVDQLQRCTAFKEITT